jgi:NADPH2:quinone reductase
MQAAWYEKQGPAHEVLVVGTTADPQPGPGEVRIRIRASGINPGDVKKRLDAFGVGMPFPRVIPHSDGAGVVDRVGSRVPASRVGQSVWCYGAQSYRPFGTAAEFTVVPEGQAVPLPDGVSFEQAACIGIPGITAHRAVHAGGPVADRTVLVQGGAGAVGLFAVGLARLAGARVIATVRSQAGVAAATAAGAHDVLCTDGLSEQDTVAALRKAAGHGIHHIVEVAFDANVGIDVEVLSSGGSIGTYATGRSTPSIPFWPLVFQNTRVYFLGSDDFPSEAKAAAARDINALLGSGWPGFSIDRTCTLAEIAEAHVQVEAGGKRGRVVVLMPDDAGRRRHDPVAKAAAISAPP